MRTFEEKVLCFPEHRTYVILPKGNKEIGGGLVDGGGGGAKREKGCGGKGGGMGAVK